MYLPKTIFQILNDPVLLSTLTEVSGIAFIFFFIMEDFLNIP